MSRIDEVKLLLKKLSKYYGRHLSMVLSQTYGLSLTDTMVLDSIYRNNRSKEEICKTMLLLPNTFETLLLNIIPKLTELLAHNKIKEFRSRYVRPNIFIRLFKKLTNIFN